MYKETNDLKSADIDQIIKDYANAMRAGRIIGNNSSIGFPSLAPRTSASDTDVEYLVSQGVSITVNE